MYIQKQDIFDNFTCIAQKCPESCCKLWQIVVDDDSMERYEALARTDDRVHEAVNVQEACFNQHSRVCAFLDNDELCYLQKTYGEEALCDTCRNYPRHVEEFENVREYSLSLSCPEAARMLLGQTEPMSFEEYEDDTEDEEFEDFDYLLYDKLLDARDFLFEIAQNRNISLWKRLEIIEDFGRKMQELYDDDRIFELDELIDQTEREAEGCSGGHAGPPLQGYCDTEKRLFSILFELEALHDDWTETLDRTWDAVFNERSPLIRQADSSSSAYTSSVSLGLTPSPQGEGFDEAAGEQLLMLFLYTYFCGAVYDGWIYSKVMLCICSVKWIFYIAYAAGNTKESLIKAAYTYAREIEHSDKNLDILEEFFMK